MILPKKNPAAVALGKLAAKKNKEKEGYFEKQVEMMQKARWKGHIKVINRKPLTDQ